MRMKLVEGRKLNSASLKANAYNDAIDMLAGLVALAALGLTLYDPGRFLPGGPLWSVRDRADHDVHGDKGGAGNEHAIDGHHAW